MSKELVSKGAIRQIIANLDNDTHTIDVERLMLCFDAMPTDYDIDKVVEQLEEIKTQYGRLQFAHNDRNMISVYVGKEQAIDCAIEIVKGGGINA